MRTCLTLSLVLFVTVARGADARDVTVTIDPARTHQTIEGFGAAYIDWTPRTPKAYDDPAFYDLVVNDLGLSIVRQQMQDELEPVNDDDDPDHFNWPAFKTGDVGAGRSFAWRQQFLEQFKKRGVTKFVMSPWTPPGFMKTHRAGRYGGHLRADMVDEYAEFMAASIILAKKNHGIDVGWITVQNELLFIEPYHSCLYNPHNLREAVRALMRKFEKEGITTKILMPEDMMYLDRMSAYIAPTMADPVTRNFPGGFATHRLGGFDVVRQWLEHTKPYNRPQWMTETSGHQQTWDGALKMAADTHEYLVGGNYSAWIYWQITDTERSGQYALLVDGDPNRSPKYHAAKHFYRYVRPGDVRIDATSSDADLLVSSFRGQMSSAAAVVLINRGDAEATVMLDYAARRDADPDGPADPHRAKSFTVYRSTSDERCAEKGTYAPGAKLTMPPKSIVTLYHEGRPFPTFAPLPAPPEAWKDPRPGETWGDPTDSPKDDAPPKSPDRSFTPLHRAILAGRLAEVDKLLGEGADVNGPNATGWTPLHAAAATFSGEGKDPGAPVTKYDVFKRVMAAKPNVDVRDDAGWTPMHAAAANAHTAWRQEVEWNLARLRDLAAARADVNAKDERGRTPLHWAAWQGHFSLSMKVTPEVVDTLLELKADPNATDDRGRTPLHYPAEMGYDAIVESLIRGGAGRAIPDGDGKTPADLAAARELTSIVQLLKAPPTVAKVNTGARPATAAATTTMPTTRPSKLGRELLRAAWDGDAARVKELLGQGADVFYVDTDGSRAIDRARDNGHAEIVDVLRAAEAKATETRQR
jgi:glucuronoarabinoxylan endo-1,4-beta-xylanase